MGAVNVTRYLTSCAFILLLIVTQSSGQQFGRNKPNYRTFDFKVRETPNFRIHHYLTNDSLVETFSDASERWYRYYQEIFRDTFPEPNPLILYANHADFWQTNALLGSVGIGTGGVTEALRNRVVMPVMEINSQTNHVLGHELVHAFQYKLLQNPADSLSLNNIQNLPLWMVEGLAEYLSIGHADTHTAMWMRDAIRENDFPSLKEMTRDMKYFPYRFGEAFWSFVTGIYGDSVIYSLFRRTAMVGYGEAIKELTGLDEKAFSEVWERNLREYYSSLRPIAKDSLAGRLIAGKKVGNLNIAPSISPNGKYVAFLSEKNFFSIDLFLADTTTGEIIKTLSSTARLSHIDEFSYLESTGTWSPLGDRFAFVSFVKGRSVLSIVDIGARGRTTTVEINGLPYFSNPAWSPNGENIVLTGMTNGESNLFVYNLRSKKLVQLTDDWYSDLHPQWSPDGKFVVFVSDRPAGGRPYKSKSLQLCFLDIREGEIKTMDIFFGAENFNPVFDPDGVNVYFLSNRDGYRNLYRYDLRSGRIFQMTDYFTGITGITAYSPALSVASKSGSIAYSYFGNRKYSIYVGKPADFQTREVQPDQTNFEAGMLPPKHRTQDVVSRHLSAVEFIRADRLESVQKPYEPKLSLEFIGQQGGVGVSTNAFGTRTGMGGAVQMLFGDMLGYQRVFASLALNGEIYDFGGQVAFLNQKRRVNWGVSLSHMPYRSANMFYKADTVLVRGDTLRTTNLVLDVFRAFEKNVTAFAYLPLSTTKRFEFGTGYSHYSFRADRYNNHYYGRYRIIEDREELPAPDGYRVGNTYGAYVFDNSYFGVASPLRGRRYRLQAETNYDFLDYSTLMADVRQYVFLNPSALAFRLFHISRYGTDAESNRIYPLTFAYPTLTRGNRMDNIDQYEGDVYSINQLYGSRLLVANAEWRVPFTGPERLSLIKSRILFSELAVFTDAGLAWTANEQPSLEAQGVETAKRIPFISTGLSLRVNVFGYVIIEPFYALPWR
ncbi:MAG TPA: tolB protein precursor, partial [Chryseosolibacter sp.]|nr:tolB protein precursor [Chryseosolibacter sp.]